MSPLQLLQSMLLRPQKRSGSIKIILSVGLTLIVIAAALNLYVRSPYFAQEEFPPDKPAAGTVSNRPTGPSRHASTSSSSDTSFSTGNSLETIADRSNTLAAQAPRRKPSKSSGELTFRPIRAAPRFPIVRDFSVVTAAKIDNQIHPDELVIGVTIAGKSRAYPINMLNGPAREILNDTLADVPIAATW